MRAIPEKIKWGGGTPLLWRGNLQCILFFSPAHIQHILKKGTNNHQYKKIKMHFIPCTTNKKSKDVQVWVTCGSVWQMSIGRCIYRVTYGSVPWGSNAIYIYMPSDLWSVTQKHTGICICRLTYGSVPQSIGRYIYAGWPIGQYHKVIAI